MATQYEDIFAQVVGITNKPSLVYETNIAIQQAVRKCHKAGKFWRDLVSVPLANVEIAELQTADLSVFPDFRQLALLQSPLQDKPLKVETLLDQVDHDGIFVRDICFAIGNTLNIRALTPSDSYTMTYWRLPIIGNIQQLNTWIYTNHVDAIVLHAAATILGMTGEQEIKGRIEKLTEMAMTDLINDNVELLGR